MNGDRISPGQLERHDITLRNSVDHILGGGVTEEAWEVSTLAVRRAGLGFRDAVSLALPAFVASRLSSRPSVAVLAAQLAESGLCEVAAFMAVFDQRTDAAMARLLVTVDTATAGRLLEEARQAAEDAQVSWDELFAAREDGPPRPPAARGSAAAFALLPVDEDEDAEHPDHPVGHGAVRIQRRLCAHLDERRFAAVWVGVEQRGDAAAIARLRELSDPDVDHSWLWSLCPHRGVVLSDDVFLDAIRARMGVAGPLEPAECALCGQLSSGCPIAHASCCAGGESTKGHNAIARKLAAEIGSADPSLEIEAQGLIPGTRLRPADLLTSILGAGLTAVDVGVASPHADRAGADCVQTMVNDKYAKYDPHAEALGRQGIACRPFCFSCYGRPHPDALAMLRDMVRRISRRRACTAHKARFRRLLAKLTGLLWARLGRQCMFCWPASSEDAAADGSTGRATDDVAFDIVESRPEDGA